MGEPRAERVGFVNSWEEMFSTWKSFCGCTLPTWAPATLCRSDARQCYNSKTDVFDDIPSAATRQTGDALSCTSLAAKVPLVLGAFVKWFSENERGGGWLSCYVCMRVCFVCVCVSVCMHIYSCVCVLHSWSRVDALRFFLYSDMNVSLFGYAYMFVHIYKHICDKRLIHTRHTFMIDMFHDRHPNIHHQCITNICIKHI